MHEHDRLAVSPFGAGTATPAAFARRRTRPTRSTVRPRPSMRRHCSGYASAQAFGDAVVCITARAYKMARRTANSEFLGSICRKRLQYSVASGRSTCASDLARFRGSSDCSAVFPTSPTKRRVCVPPVSCGGGRNVQKQRIRVLLNEPLNLAQASAARFCIVRPRPICMQAEYSGREKSAAGVAPFVTPHY
jgi:hypothetical protein